MPNFQRPDGSISDGNWTSTPLFEKIDDAIPNDTEDIRSESDPTNDIFEVSLTDLTDPAVSTGHIVRIRMTKATSGGGQQRDLDIIVGLYQSTTLIASATFSDIAVGIATVTFTLTGGEADNITDYDDLRVRVDANVVGGSRTSWCEVSGIEFETPSASFVVEQVGWRWFLDGTGSLTAMAAENTKPTLPGDENYGVVRVRVELEETSGGSDSNKIVKMQMSGDDGTTWEDMVLDAAAPEKHLHVTNGADTNGNTITSRLLANTDTSGEYHEDQSGTESLLANESLEVDFALFTRVVVPDSDYRFRMFWDGVAVPIKSGSVKIELRGSTVASREWTDGVLNSVNPLLEPGSGDPDAAGHGHGFRGFYDGTRWWVFWADREVSTTAFNYKHSTNPGVVAWSSASTVSFTNIKDSQDVNIIFKDIGGTLYVVAMVGDTASQRFFKRGTISGTTITWDSTERTFSNPFDDDDNGSPGLVIDEGDFLWVAGKGQDVGTELWAQRSVNAITNATYYTFNTAHSASEANIFVVAPFSGPEVISLASDEVLLVYYDGGNNNLRARKCTESGGMGSPVTINTSTNAHDNDWGVVKATDGNVYCVYGDDTANNYAWLLRVYDISGDSWATGTDPSVDKGASGTSNDGLLVHWGDDGMLYASDTAGDSDSRDTRSRYKAYTGGTAGTWDGSLSFLSPGGTQATAIGNADARASFANSPQRWVVLMERGDDAFVGTDYVLEFYVLDTAAGSIIVTPGVVALGFAAPLPTVLAASVVEPAVAGLPFDLPLPAALAASRVTPAVAGLPFDLPLPQALAASVVTPSVADLIFDLPTPVLSVPITVTPVVNPLVFDLPLPQAQAASVVTPSANDLVVGLPSPAALAAANVTPSVADLVFGLPLPSILAAAVVTPSANDLVFDLPLPAAVIAINVNPALADLVFDLPLSTILAASVVSPGVVPLVFGLPLPQALAASNVTPSVVGLPFDLPLPAALAASVVTPSVADLVFDLPLPAALAASLVTPSVADLIFDLPLPAAVIGAVSVFPAVNPLVFDLPTPTIIAAPTVTPAASALVYGMPTPAVLAASNVAPAANGLVFGLPLPQALAASNVSPLTAGLTLAVPLPGVIAASNVTPGVASLVLDLPLAALSVAPTVTPSVIGLVLAAPTPILSIPATVTPVVVGLILAIPIPTVGVLIFVRRVAGGRTVVTSRRDGGGSSASARTSGGRTTVTSRTSG